MTRRLRMMARVCTGVEVLSLADGTLLVKPAWREPSVEPGYPPVGVVTRLALAEEVQALLTERIVRDGRG